MPIRTKSLRLGSVSVPLNARRCNKVVNRARPRPSSAWFSSFCSLLDNGISSTRWISLAGCSSATFVPAVISTATSAPRFSLDEGTNNISPNEPLSMSSLEKKEKTEAPAI